MVAYRWWAGRWSRKWWMRLETLSGVHSLRDCALEGLREIKTCFIWISQLSVASVESFYIWQTNLSTILYWQTNELTGIVLKIICSDFRLISRTGLIFLQKGRREEVGLLVVGSLAMARETFKIIAEDERSWEMLMCVIVGKLNSRCKERRMSRRGGGGVEGEVIN